jgi:uncharacterized protein involved in exopolysaccharide biosynthesis
MENNIQTILADQESDIDLKILVGKYLRNWKLFVVTILLSLITGVIYLRYTPKVFEVSSVILIKDEEKGLGDGNEILKDLAMFSGNKIVENEMEIFRAKSLMKSVIQSLRLNIQYSKTDTPLDKDLYGKSPIWIQADTLFSTVYKEKIVLKIIDNTKFELLNDGNLIGTYQFGKLIKSNLVGRIRYFKILNFSERMKK